MILNWYSLREASRAFGIPEQSLRRRILTGDLPAWPVDDNREYVLRSSDLRSGFEPSPSRPVLRAIMARWKLLIPLALAVGAGLVFLATWPHTRLTEDYCVRCSARRSVTRSLGQLKSTSRIIPGPWTSEIEKATGSCSHSWVRNAESTECLLGKGYSCGRVGSRLSTVMKLERARVLSAARSVDPIGVVDLIRWCLQNETWPCVRLPEPREPIFDSREDFQSWFAAFRQGDPTPKPQARKGLREAVDGYLDARWKYPQDATDKLIAQLDGVPFAEVEKLLRAGRASYGEPPQPRGKYTGGIPLQCDHVDYSTVYFLYVPKSYDPKKAAPLVIAGHGGSAARDRKFGEKAALGGTVPFWTDQAEKDGFLLAAPITSRGWGAIGNSILFSLISKLQREYRIDPDRVYVTGHSMGGHLAWRCGLYLSDRWGAVGPMSAGYDFVKEKSVSHLFNIPVYATYGTQEPFEINPFNDKIKKWLEERGFPWKIVEKEGGHDIYPDEIPRMAKFFAEHPRNLYPARVYARGGGTLVQDTPDTNANWDKQHTWTNGRPIPMSTFHWVRLIPLPADTPKEKATQTAWAVNKGDNTIEVTSENARKLRLYLHDKMVNFDKPVRVVVNGEKLFDRTVARDLRTMQELVREFDDRGRIFHAAIDLEIATDKPVAEPTYK